ncbi:MAG TPA: hypothetical protein VJ831_12525 [Jatrophihabitantaceae bacterium]|nr:hypothetical protein [Jatrophihabitantaceae bacterium]
MNTQTTRETKVAERTTTPADPFLEAAAQRLYDSECALHAARVTGVDEWIAAAADRLHTSLVAYLEANAAS